MKTDSEATGVETLGSMKVVDIQDKDGYSLITFELPEDCKQFLIEYALRELITKAATETLEKYGSILPKAIDKPVNLCYNQDTEDDWIPNTGYQPVDDNVLVDTLWNDGTVERADPADSWAFWNRSRGIIYWRLSKTKGEKNG